MRRDLPKPNTQKTACYASDLGIEALRFIAQKKPQANWSEPLSSKLRQREFGSLKSVSGSDRCFDFDDSKLPYCSLIEGPPIAVDLIDAGNEVVSNLRGNQEDALPAAPELARHRACELDLDCLCIVESISLL